MVVSKSPCRRMRRKLLICSSSTVSKNLWQSYSLPMSGTAGDLVVISCPTDGNVQSGHYVKIGEREMQILAATRGSVVVLNNYDRPGLTTIETNIGGEA